MYTKIIIIIISISLFIAIYTCFFPLNEYYTDNPLLIWKTSINNKKLWIKWLPEYNGLWKNKCKSIKNLEIIENTKKLYYDSTTVVDCFTYMNLNEKKNKVLLIVPECMYLFFIKPRDNINNEKFIDIVSKGGTFGYTSQNMLSLIIIIGNGLNIKTDKIKCKKINPPIIINDSLFKNEGIDVLFCYNTLTDPQYYNMYDPLFNIDFVDYSEINVDIFKYYIPFAKWNNVSLDIYFSKFKDPFPVRTLISIDLLIYGPESIENNLTLRDTIFSLLVLADNFPVLNYYTIFFEFWSQTIELLRHKNNYLQTRDSLTILEQFSPENDYFELSVNNNIDGFYELENLVFKINDVQINNIPLQLGWRVIFNNQTDKSQNGEYFVKKINNNKCLSVLEKKLTLKGSDFKVDINNNVILDKNLLWIDGINRKNIKKDDIIWIQHLQKWGHLIPNQNIIILFDPNAEQSLDDSRWNCTDPTIKIKGLCDSEYDLDGITKKPVPTFWDRRCELDSECPFYQANKNYPNYRGQCKDGFCEMPIGINRIAYRLYNTQSKPLCWGCAGNVINDCCEQQKNKKLYPDKNGPDYAYPLDTFERLLPKNNYL